MPRRRIRARPNTRYTARACRRPTLRSGCLASSPPVRPIIIRVQQANVKRRRLAGEARHAKRSGTAPYHTNHDADVPWMRSEQAWPATPNQQPRTALTETIVFAETDMQPELRIVAA